MKRHLADILLKKRLVDIPLPTPQPPTALKDYLYGLRRYDKTKLKQLESLLIDKGAFELNTVQVRWQDGRAQRSGTIVRAADTGMQPMGTHWWARDNAIVAARLLATARMTSTRKKEYKQLGCTMLLSTLDIMSSATQLERFHNVIRTRDQRFHHLHSSWPHIFLEIADNLSGVKNESWSHKQDAWQMVAYFTLEAIEHGDITWKDLSSRHREMLGSCMPFLAKTTFWQDENSGSWEELTAVRSSVLAWDLALLYKLQRAAIQQEGMFLIKAYDDYKPHLDDTYSNMSFHDATSALLNRGAEVLARLLPYESPNYPKNDPRYRETDAALIYLLQLDSAALLAELLGKDDGWIRVTEDKIIEQINRLDDKRTGGIRRYLDDSYQGTNFFDNDTSGKLDAMYAQLNEAASQDGIFAWLRRRKIVPVGPEAAWVHPIWQMSSWAGRRYAETNDHHYLAYQRQYLERGISLITGEGSLTIEKLPSSNARINTVSSWRIPEAYITERLNQRREIILPSPDTPLNWAVGEAIYAVAMARSA